MNVYYKYAGIIIKTNEKKIESTFLKHAKTNYVEQNYINF